MAVILEDYFTEQLAKMNELSDEEQGYVDMPSAVQDLDNSPAKSMGRRSTVMLKHSPNPHNGEMEEDEKNVEKCSQIEYKFEKARFTVPFIVYKWMGVWRFLDEVALNFHLVTATITVAFCLHFQISLFFSFYLLCTVALCIRASFALQNKGVFNNGAAQINVDEAHQTNKTYMKQATTKLLKVRKRQWDI